MTGGLVVGSMAAHRGVAEEVVAPLDLIDHVAVWTTRAGLPAARLTASVAEPVLDVPLVVTTAERLPRWIGGATLLLLVDPDGDGGGVIDEAAERGGPVIGLSAAEDVLAALDDHDMALVELPADDAVTAAAVALLELLELDGSVDEETLQRRWTELDRHT